MRRRAATFIVLAILIALAGLALWLRADTPGSWLWRARLVSLVADRDSDVRNNLLREEYDPFELRRRLLSVPSNGSDADAWRAYVSAAAAPRPNYEAMEAAVAELDAEDLPRGAADAYRYLLLWTYWQRNRIGSAGATLDGLAASGLPAAQAAASLGRAADPQGTVQLVLPGTVRAAAAGSAGTRYKLRRLLQLATRRLSVEGTLELAAPPIARLELVTLSVNEQEFTRLAILPGGETEIVTPRTTIRGPGPWVSAGNHRFKLVWDGPTEETTVSVAGQADLSAPGAIASLEPPAEIEILFANTAPAVLRDVVVAASPRGSLPAAH